MAVLEQIAKTARTWLIISRHKTLALPRAPFRSYQLISGNQIYTNASNIWQPKFGPNLKAPYCMIPAMLAGLVGVGMVEVVQADANEITANSASSEASTNIGSIEETARKERQFIEELLRSKGVRYGSYPGFSVSVKGPRVSIKFQAPPACEVSQLIANLVSHLGLKVDEHGGGSDMLLRAWDSTVAWQLTLTRPGSQKDTGGSQEHSNMHAEDGELCIVIFRSLINSKSTEIEFIKQGHLSLKELEALVSVLQLAGGTSGQNNSLGKRSREGIIQTPSTEKSISSLESMGVRIYGVDEIHVDASNNVISWENIAGYDQQKREIEDMILLALHRPEIYDDIAHGTRCKFQSNRPRAVLFEGPPGTGKTSCARVIAKQAGVPLLYVPLEVVLSKYYGESERLLGKVFSLADDLPNGAIIFLDEVDSFATARDSEMHEATRRILSVILRQIDGFEQDKKVVVIAATNRKQDLDPALISRFDSMITFGLPDKKNRNEIAAQYAKQLTKTELNKFAEVTDGMSGRDIRDVCQQAERSWASKIIRGVVSTDGEQITLPPLQEYIDSAMTRQKTLLAITEQKLKESAARTKKAQLA